MANIISGADSEEEAHTLRERFLDLLVSNGMIAEPDDGWSRIQNLVCTAELGESLNLNALAIGLGLEKTEYEPEQFFDLIYRPPGADSVVLLFASGRVVAGVVDGAIRTSERSERERTERVRFESVPHRPTL